MLITNTRLLAGLQDAVDSLVALNGTPQAKSLHAAATTMLCELLRRDDSQRNLDDYAAGRTLGCELAALLPASSPGAASLAALPATMDEEIGDAAHIDLLSRLRTVLTQLTSESGYPHGAGTNAGATIDAKVLDLFTWENNVRSLPPPHQPAPRPALDMRNVIEKSMRRQGGTLADARVTDCAPLTGGFGKSTFLFEAKDGAGRPLRLVARAMSDINLLGLPGQDIGREFHGLRYTHRHGIRVAEPLWLENDQSKYGIRFLVSRQVEGRNLGTAVSAEPLNDAQVKSLARELAKIHALPIDAADADLAKSAIDARQGSQSLATVTSAFLQTWEDLWRTIDIGNHPVVTATFQWLRASLPRSDDAPVFLHGDYALHNILIEGDQVNAVLDWELHHVGDRAEDISWLLSSIGKHVTREQFMREYLAAGGSEVSEFQIRYYEVLVHLKMLIVTLELQLRFQTVPHAGPHYCIPGLAFIQHPSGSLAAAIRAAEAVQ